MAARIPKAIQGAFDAFKAEVPGLLGELEALLSASPRYAGVRPRFDNESADKIESFYRSVIAGTERANVSPERLSRIMQAYFGEAMKARAGGEWGLTSFKSDSAYGKPLILGWGGRISVRFCPEEWLSRIARTTENFVARNLEYCEHFEENWQAEEQRIDERIDKLNKEVRAQKKADRERQ
jgi:hypothetical protein